MENLWLVKIDPSKSGKVSRVHRRSAARKQIFINTPEGLQDCAKLVVHTFWKKNGGHHGGNSPNFWLNQNHQNSQARPGRSGTPRLVPMYPHRLAWSQYPYARCIFAYIGTINTPVTPQNCALSWQNGHQSNYRAYSKNMAEIRHFNMCYFRGWARKNCGVRP